MDAPGRSAVGVDTAALLRVIVEAARAVRDAVGAMAGEDRRRTTGRRGQYLLDLVADRVVTEALHAAGVATLSEESGLSSPAVADGAASGLLAVVDPVDGSTNAAMGIPWFASSICVLDGEGPLVAVVLNLPAGNQFDAVRDGGARLDGAPIEPSGCVSLAGAVVGISGLPATHPGWAQFRALGAASLDLCAVAAGNLDGYRVVGGSGLHAWDYLGALLVLREAGASIAELDGKDLVVRDSSPRRPVAAATLALLSELGSAEL